MKNIDLNAGGLIGALACGGITAAVVFATVNPANAGRASAKFIIVALVGGAFAGNFLWGLVFKKSEPRPKKSGHRRPDRGTSARQSDGRGRQPEDD